MSHEPSAVSARQLPKSRETLVFLAILVAYCGYAGWFIYRTSFMVEGERYFSLFDDAMVSMRYARNLTLGHGLVWNPGGERVEGFSNPLWVAYMAVLHLLPLASSKMSVLVQASGAVLLLVNLLFVRRIAASISKGSRWWPWPPCSSLPSTTPSTTGD